MKNSDEMSREMAQVDAQAPQGSRWQHLKSGGEYMVVGHCFLEATAAPAILYSATGEGEHPIWAREATEFLDGRFQKQST